jgi:hypothetical protein
MKEIKLTKGMVALIDDCDLEKASQYKWRARKGRHSYYATAIIGDWREKKEIHLHNLIINPPPGFVVDHIDLNGLNCQRHNMRNCTNTQNGKNRSAWGLSKYLGVSIVRHKTCIRWEAKIFSDGNRKYLGSFKTEEDAAIAYNDAAKIFHGEYANLNIIQKTI